MIAVIAEIAGLVVTAAVGVGGWFLIPNLFRSEPRSGVFLQRVFVGALLLRVVVAVATYHAFPYGYLAPDEAGYVAAGRDILSGQVDLGAAVNGQGWQYFNALVYLIFGVQPLLPRLWNCVIGAMVPILVYLLARRLGARRGAMVGAVLAAVFPSVVLWSSLNLKDADVWFLVLTALFVGLQLQERVTAARMAVVALSLAGLWPLRQFADFGLAVGLAVGWVWANQRVRALGARSAAGVRLATPLAVMAAVASSAVLVLLYGLNGARLAHLRHSLAEGARSATNPDPGIATVAGAIAFLPAGLRDFFLRPFPWETGTSLYALTRPETVAYYLCLLVAVAGVVRSLRDATSRALTLLVFLALSGAGYALVLANLGTIYRERDQLVLVIFVFVAVGIEAVLGSAFSTGHAARESAG